MVLAFRAAAIPIVCVAVIFQRNPYVYAVVKGSGIHKPQDFVGKRLMLPPDAEIQHNALMQKLGIPPTDMTYAPYDRDEPFLAEGRIDAQVVYRIGSGLRLEKNGLDLEFIWMADYGIRLYADSIVTSEKMIREKPDLVQRFLMAALKGWQYAIEHPGDALSATLAYDNTLSPDYQMRMLQIQTPLIHTGDHPIGWMRPEVWQDMESFIRFKGDKKKIQAYTLDFIKPIYGEKERG